VIAPARRRVTALAPTVVFSLVVLGPLVALGEERPAPGQHGGAASASASPSARPKPKAPPASTGFLPDPPVTSANRTYRYPVQVTDGTVSVGRPRLVTHTSPVATPRTMGRFALELYVGRELLERVRFDLPLLDAPSPPRSPSAPPDFARHASVRVHVELPALERATYAVWVDRATGEKKRIFWPPVDDFVPAPRASASASSSATPAPSAGRGTPEAP
jgi:hypothetical protein